MTNDEKRIAIAEKCGYRNIRYDWIDGGNTGKDWFHDKGRGIPYYLSDLNACHEMEKTLDTFQQADYVNFLYRFNEKSNWPYFVHPDCFAPAAQRCDAFLLTHGFKL